MGLDTTHNAWHGPYSAFMRWRIELQRAAGLPPLRKMEGFQDATDTDDPILWNGIKDRPLLILLTHSDCDGEIKWKDCKAIADDLKTLLPNISDGLHVDYIERTHEFIKGLMKAYAAKENLEFH